MFLVLRLIVRKRGRVAGRGCVRVLFVPLILGLFVGFFGGVLSNKKRRRADGVKIG